MRPRVYRRRISEIYRVVERLEVNRPRVLVQAVVKSPCGRALIGVALTEDSPPIRKIGRVHPCGYCEGHTGNIEVPTYDDAGIVIIVVVVICCIELQCSSNFSRSPDRTDVAP